MIEIVYLYLQSIIVFCFLFTDERAPQKLFPATSMRACCPGAAAFPVAISGT